LKIKEVGFGSNLFQGRNWSHAIHTDGIGESQSFLSHGGRGGEVGSKVSIIKDLLKFLIE